MNRPGEAHHPPAVNELLTTGAVPGCYYATGPAQRPHCEQLAVVRYGPIALCHQCDLRRSAVGKGTTAVRFADPAALVDTVAARDTLARAEAALGEAVAQARHAGHPWSTIGAVLGVSRQAAQQRFAVRRPAGPAR